MGWWGALLVVPLALAAFGMLWPVPQTLRPLDAVAPVPAPLDPGAQRVTLAAALASAGTVTFAADRTELVGPSAATVERVARLLGAGPGPRVALTGYAADAPGPAAVAQRLSEQRPPSSSTRWWPPGWTGTASSPRGAASRIRSRPRP